MKPLEEKLIGPHKFVFLKTKGLDIDNLDFSFVIT